MMASRPQTLYGLVDSPVGLAAYLLDRGGSGGPPAAVHVAISVAVSVFPDEISAASRSWAERAFPKLVHYNRLSKAGHFAAWEQPQLFSEEIRAALRSLR